MCSWQRNAKLAANGGVPTEAMLKSMRRSSTVRLVNSARKKTLSILGLRRKKKKTKKTKKEFVKRMLMFQILGITGFQGVPFLAKIRLKIRIQTSKAVLSIPFVDDPRKFPPQTVPIWTYDPAHDTAHVFLRYKSKRR